MKFKIQLILVRLAPDGGRVEAGKLTKSVLVELLMMHSLRWRLFKRSPLR